MTSGYDECSRPKGQLEANTVRSGPNASMQVMTQGRSESIVQLRIADIQSGDLDDDVGCLGEADDLALPECEVLIVATAREAGVVEADAHARVVGGQALDIGVRVRSGVHTAHQAMLLQVGEAPQPGGVAKVVIVAVLAYAPHVGELHVALDDLRGVGLGEVDLGHDAVRMAKSVGEGLQPARLLDRVLDAPGALDVDGLHHVREAHLGQPVVSPVALRLDGADVLQDLVAGAGLEQVVAQLRVLQIVEMDVRVDERHLRHGRSSSVDADWLLHS